MFSENLSDLAGLGDDRVPLAESALRIALLEYPRLNPAPWLRELDTLADRARLIAGSDDPDVLIEAVNTALFVEAGFHGNSGAYYDPRNSYLNDVLDRRVGIPITLSVIYLEVGWRLGLRVRGIGFPGHFLVGIERADGLGLIDPFHRGVRLTRDDCVRLVPGSDDGEVLMDESFFATVSNRQILLRMLTNLKMVYVQRHDFSRAIAAIDRSLQLEPAADVELRDRGMVRLQAGDIRHAVRDLEAYLDRAKAGADRETAVTALGAARRQLARFN